MYYGCHDVTEILLDVTIFANIFSLLVLNISFLYIFVPI